MIVEPEIEAIPQVQLGDLTMIAQWPGKMVKALAAVASTLHQSYDLQPDTQRGGSKETCVFSSLCVRDFLVHLGFEDATVRSCALIMRALKDDKEVHSLGIGVPGQDDIDGKFNGHVVCTVPSLSLLIDVTLYPAIRPAWGGALTGMLAMPFYAPSTQKGPYGLYVIGGIELCSEETLFEIAYLDRPELTKAWKRSVDFQTKSPRRRAVTKALIDAFGEWDD